MEIKVSKSGFTVRAFGETWLECLAMIGVDANGQRDSDDRFVPVMGYEQTKQGNMVIPDLYYLSPAKGVPFDQDDIDLIRRIWAQYEEGLPRDFEQETEEVRNYYTDSE